MATVTYTVTIETDNRQWDSAYGPEIPPGLDAVNVLADLDFRDAMQEAITKLYGCGDLLTVRVETTDTDTDDDNN